MSSSVLRLLGLSLSIMKAPGAVSHGLGLRASVEGGESDEIEKNGRKRRKKDDKQTKKDEKKKKKEEEKEEKKSSVFEKKQNHVFHEKSLLSTLSRMLFTKNCHI